MKQIYIILFFLVSVSGFAQNSILNQDSIICESKFELAKDSNLNTLSIGKIVEAIGKSFIGTKYVANTLEKNNIEQLIVNLQELDCTTFLETTFALSRTIKKDKLTFDDFKKELQFIRYRNGIINGYPSRLHYTSDWILNNEEKKIVKNISQEIGGVLFETKVNYMSLHADEYKILNDNPKFLPQIIEAENNVNNTVKYYIPKNKINEIESKIETGDFIGLTTTIPGMDVSHVGIAIKNSDGHVYFLHAPMAGKKVTLTTKTLSEYLDGNKKNTGILVFRPCEIK